MSSFACIMAPSRDYCLILPFFLFIFQLSATITVSTASASVAGSGTYSNSIPKLRELAHADFVFARRLEALLEDQKDVPSEEVENVANGYLEEFENSTTSESRSNATAHAEQILTNPLLIFKLMRRVAFLARILRSPDSGLEKLIKKTFPSIGPGTMKDLADAMDGILQIHFIYNLKATDIASGRIGGKGTEVKLLAFHCFHIGMRARNQRQYALAIAWLREAVRLASIDGTVDIPTVQSKLLRTIRDHNFLWDNGGLFDMHLYARPVKLVGANEEVDHTLKARELLEAKHAGKGRNCSYWPVNTWGLCAGQNLRTSNASASLFCWYEFKAHKVLAIHPLKMEFLSRNPDIVQIYDAFDNLQVSEDGLSRNESFKDLEHFIASGAISHGASPMSGGLFKVSQFLPGTPNDAQVDALSQDEKGTDGRDATLMLNLNKVDAGGYTVFPAAHATSVPTQGSAIFWFNTLSDGSVDLSTTHAHCHVILGHKSVAHKWLSFSNGKCLLKPYKRFQILVNGKALPVPAAFHHELITKEECAQSEPFTALDVAVEMDYYWKKLLKYAYGSMRSITSLIQLDWEIHRAIKSMSTGKMALDQPWEMIEAYMQDFNETTYNAISEMANGTAQNEAVSKLAWNPLAIFRTMWRFENHVKIWTVSAQKKGQRSPGLFLPVLREYIETVYANASNGPTHRDLEYSVIGILMMQEAYDLKSKDISEGIIAGIGTGIKLCAAQCRVFGRVAIAQELFYIGVEWMETAMAKAAVEGQSAAALAATELELETAIKAHDLEFKRTRGRGSSTYTQSVSSGVKYRRTSWRTNREVQYDKYKLSTDANHAIINYFGLCRGQRHQTVQEQSQPFCWYETTVGAYWKIRPLKAELLSMYPKAEIVQFHDILPNKLMEYLLNDTNKPNDPVLSVMAQDLDPIHRLGVTLWHFTNSSQELRRILKIVESASGLRGVAGDLRTRLQIGTYPPGSHYKAHPDTIDFGKHEGDVARIATFMFYLSDVVKGGATVFAQAGLHIPPERGSAIFWYNQLSTGVLDDRTFHGACPVIFGEKQIATQWLRYEHQDHLKCPLDQGKAIEILVNGKSKYGL